MAGNSVRLTTKSDLVKSSALTVAFSALSVYVVSLIWDIHVYDGMVIAALVAFLVSILWGIIMANIAEKNFGMVNGDVLGATNESSRALILIISLIVVMSV